MEQVLQLSLLILLILVALLLLFTGIFNFIRQIKDEKEKKKLDDLFKEVCNKFIDELMHSKEDDSDASQEPSTINYSKMTIAELKDIAKTNNIKGYYKMKKDELVKCLTEEDK